MATGELVFFQGLWLIRKHKCTVCGENLPIFSVYYMSHILPKSTYGKFRLYDKNVDIMCGICHPLWEHHQKDIKNKSQWRWVFIKKKQLKQEYKELK